MRAKMLFSPHDSVVVQKENLFNDALMRYSTAVAAQYCLMDGGEEMALAQLDSTYNKFNDSVVNPADYPLLAKIWLQKGNPGKAAEYLGKYSGEAGSPDDLLELYDVSAKVALRRGDYKGASANMQRYIALKDSIEFAARSESVREAEQQFWRRQLEEENYSIRVRNHYLVAIYFLLFMIVAGAGSVLFVLMRRKFRMKNVQLAQYAEAIDNLGTRVSTAESTRENLLSQLDVQKAKEKELKELLENRFSEVRELIRTYYEFGNSKKLQKKVDDLLKLQLSGDNFEVIEQVVNAKNNDVMKMVRERYPNMKEDNLKLLNLIYAGFSAQEISVILNDTPQNIYVRKSRLKKSLQELIAQDAKFNV
jgi:DNA-binding transcriptional MerR regulator